MAEASGAHQVSGGRRWQTVIRWLLIVIFAWSAGGKFFWPGKLHDLLQRTGMVPRQLVRPVAYILPAAELALALGLAIRPLRVAALLAAIFLSTLFVGIHSYLLARGDVVPCGCVGVSINFDNRWFHVVLLILSMGMLAGSVLLLLSDGRPLAQPVNNDPRAASGR